MTSWPHQRAEHLIAFIQQHPNHEYESVIHGLPDMSDIVSVGVVGRWNVAFEYKAFCPPTSSILVLR